MRPVSILTVLPDAIRGGPSTQHLNFIRALPEHRFTVHAVIPENHEVEADYIGAAASVHPLPMIPRVPRTLSPVKLGRFTSQTRDASRRIAAIGRQLDVRLVHVFNEILPAGTSAAKRIGVPSVVHILGMSIFEPVWVGTVWLRFLRRSADHIVGCQDAIVDKLVAHGVPRSMTSIIYNSIDPEGLRRVAGERTKPSLLPEGLIVGMVSGMDPRKGQLDFVRAAAIVRESDPSINFVMIGGFHEADPYFRQVRDEIHRLELLQHVHLTGSVANAATWMRHMDIYCNTSLTEALSVAVLEAMALERPVVATDVGGNHISVADGETGLLAREGDPGDLAKKILRLAADPTMRNDMGRKGALRVNSLFSVEHNAARLADVFTRLAKEAGS